MNFLSVCSGIEAASCAWNPLGWKAAAFSEIEPFPCSVLAHHFPSVPNFGDMTQFKDWPDELAIDLLCGGTPCQSFSVAGLRKGLADPRGNLMLTYGAIAAKYRPRWLVWENVPGVLSSNGGRDFGSFLGLLGELGYGFAYRVLDAQYTGVPQRRRRVFVVGCLGDWRSAAAVLFERHSLSGHPAPRRESRKGITGTLSARTSGGGGLGTDFEFGGGLVPQGFGGETAPTLNAAFGSKLGLDNQHIDSGAGVFVAHTLRGEGFDASEDGTGRGTPIVPVGAVKYAYYSNDYANDRVTDASGVNPALTASTSGSGNLNVLAGIAYTTKLHNTTSNNAGKIFEERSTCLDANSPPPAVMYEISAGAESNLEENKGFNHIGGNHASTQETNAITLLRRVRSAVGEEAFAKWGLGILDSLQSPEILRSALHGSELRPAAFSRRWVVCCALGSPFTRSDGALRSMREAAGEGCASQGWGLSEQYLDQLGAYLSELSRPGAQAERFMFDLWQAAEGFGLLRDALSAVQEARRPVGRQGQPVRSAAQGGAIEPGQGLPGSGLCGEVSRERVLRQACPAGESRDVGAAAADQERSGFAPMAVRRLIVEECEFLQGFPRGYTAIPHRGKPAADGPRYKALGNSWAVPVARWVGERIDAVNAIHALAGEAA